jgi:hypothetical protein
LVCADLVKHLSASKQVTCTVVCTPEEAAAAADQLLSETTALPTRDSINLVVWVARKDAAPLALLPPSVIRGEATGDAAMRRDYGRPDAVIIAQAAVGPPLELTHDDIHRDGVRALRRRLPAIVDRWLDEVHSALTLLAETLRDVRRALAGFRSTTTSIEGPTALRSVGRPVVVPFVADGADLWNDAAKTPLDYDPPALMVAGSARAMRWFSDAPEDAFLLVQSDSPSSWMAYWPGETTHAEVQAWVLGWRRPSDQGVVYLPV